ncbi:MAG: hypothetical protein Gyms2KO_23050 [Gymnodinialimonas sp.]
MAPPQTFDTFVVLLPARSPKQDSKPGMAMSAMLAHLLDHVRDQTFFVSTTNGQSPSCGPVLIQNTANPSLRNLHLAADQVEAGAPLGRLLCNRLPGNGRREGLRSFPYGFQEDRLVQCKIGNGTKKALILLL